METEDRAPWGGCEHTGWEKARRIEIKIADNIAARLSRFEKIETQCKTKKKLVDRLWEASGSGEIKFRK